MLCSDRGFACSTSDFDIVCIVEVFTINRNVHQRALEGDVEPPWRHENQGPLLIRFYGQNRRNLEILQFRELSEFATGQEYVFCFVLHADRQSEIGDRKLECWTFLEMLKIVAFCF